MLPELELTEEAREDAEEAAAVPLLEEEEAVGGNLQAATEPSEDLVVDLAEVGLPVAGEIPDLEEGVVQSVKAAGFLLQQQLEQKREEIPQKGEALVPQKESKSAQRKRERYGAHVALESKHLSKLKTKKASKAKYPAPSTQPEVERRLQRWDLPNVPEPSVTISGRRARSTKFQEVVKKLPKSEREEWRLHKIALKIKHNGEAWAPRKKLSPEAMEGIRTLHAQHGNLYPTQRLAELFKVTPEAIRKIIKGRWRPTTEEEANKRLERWQKRKYRIRELKIQEGTFRTKLGKTQAKERKKIWGMSQEDRGEKDRLKAKFGFGRRESPTETALKEEREKRTREEEREKRAKEEERERMRERLGLTQGKRFL